MAEGLRLSIIVPVYNGESYLEQCLASLHAQDMRNAEFICIDDGSRDNTLAILRDYARKDDRFEVVTKENSGYGDTVNRGIGMARGEYVGLLESDDWIDPGAYAALLDLAESSGRPDIVKANHYRFNDDSGDGRLIENYPEKLCGEVIELPDPRIEKLVLSVPAIWAALYRRGFLLENGISCLATPGASFQDTGFVYKAWAAARRVIITHQAFLHYRFGNAGSSTVSEHKAFCVLDEWDSIGRFVEDGGYSDETLLAALAAKKFQTYRWNLARISKAEAANFIDRACLDLLGECERGRFEQAMFSPGEWMMLQRWLFESESLKRDVAIEKESFPPARFLLRAKRKALATVHAPLSS